LRGRARLWLALAALVAACAPPPTEAPQQLAASAPGSNVLRGDYAGSAACRDCHPREYEAWMRSPMHRMTRVAEGNEVRAPFDTVFRFMGDSAELFQSEGDRYMKLSSQRFGGALYRVTKVIGGHYREDFAGVAVTEPGPRGVRRGDERLLPVSYLLFDASFRYKGYSVMSPERPGLRRGLVWRQSCILCHNTAPHLTALYDELYGLGAPGYQGAASLELPPERDFRYEVTDPRALAEALRVELAELGAPEPLSGDVPAMLRTAIERTRRHFGESELVELGVGCEACHGGSRAHVESPGRVRPSYEILAPFLRVTNADGRPLGRAESINRTCARCHSVLFSRYPFTWEGRDRGYDPGGSSMNSGEARDLLLSRCGRALDCARCHDAHAEDTQQRKDWLRSIAGNAVCVDCHQSYRSPLALAGHSRHAADGAGSVCINCHMPQKNVGLDYRLTGYHNVGSPTDRERVEHDRPLECALCHAEMSVGDIVRRMQSWWKKSYEPASLRKLYGPDPSVNALAATLEHGKAHERVVAVDRLGRAAAAKDYTELLARSLTDEYPLVRFFAKAALERALARPLPIDPQAGVEEIERELAAVLASDRDMPDTMPAP
jgi:predicted CXXCH cytochrome family protein